MSARVVQRRGKWVVRVDHRGQQVLKSFGATKDDKRRAQKAADEINHRIALRQFAPSESRPPDPVPFKRLAEEWLRREIELPIERGHSNHVKAGTAARYRGEVDVHLSPYFGGRDVRSIGVAEVQAFVGHCVETGRPRSAKSIEMLLTVLRLILAYAQRRDLVAVNAVGEWKNRRPRQRGLAGQSLPRERVLTWEERQGVLTAAAELYPRYYPLVLFLAETGCRLGEGIALRWIDVDLESGWARICRSFSSDSDLTTTKTRREREVSLSSSVRGVLFDLLPNVVPVPEDVLVFPGPSGFLCSRYFRETVFRRIVRQALGKDRHHSPHVLRHTWASLHLARGTPIKWVQAQGGWTTAKVLLDVYGHYLPTESRGFEDALGDQDGTIRDRAGQGGGRRSQTLAQPTGLVKQSASQLPGNSPRSPIMHFTLPPPFL